MTSHSGSAYVTIFDRGWKKTVEHNLKYTMFISLGNKRKPVTCKSLQSASKQLYVESLLQGYFNSQLLHTMVVDLCHIFFFVWLLRNNYNRCLVVISGRRRKDENTKIFTFAAIGRNNDNLRLFVLSPSQTKGRNNDNLGLFVLSLSPRKDEMVQISTMIFFLNYPFLNFTVSVVISY